MVPGPLEQRTGGYLYDARMASGLRACGWTVIVHSLEGSFPDADERAADGLADALAGIPQGARVLIDGLALGGLPGPVQAHRARLRMLAMVHHPLADESGLAPELKARLARLEPEALAACTGVVVTSPFTAWRVAAGYGIPEARVRAAPPGVGPAPRARGPAEGEPPRLLCVGTVTPRKGQDVLIRALARITALEWICLCAGSLTRAPGYVRMVLELAHRSGLACRIQFAGECRREDLDELYHSSSLFVLPSRYEGYGMALAEAMARGLAIVSTTGGAIPHTVPPEAGVLVPPGDDRALAEALAGLLSDVDGAQRRSALGSAARDHARRLPGWDHAVRTLATAIRELAPDG